MKPNESEFPVTGLAFRSVGITKREHFAGLMLQSLLSIMPINQKDGTPHTHETLAVEAVKSANALLSELEKDSK